MPLVEYADSKIALGGEVTIHFISSHPKQEANNLMNDLWRYIFQFEKKFSRFISSSELSTFNRDAGLKFYISPEFKDILSQAKQISQKTDGMYNPFILPALHRAGYVQSAVSNYEKDWQENYSRKSVANVSKLVIGDNFAQIPFETAIDLGGCGKGYLADKLSEILIDNNVEGFWLNISGDIATKGKDLEDENIRVAIQNAGNANGQASYQAIMPTTKYAIATSGTLNRKNLELKGHHIIDPRTCKPAETDIILATICSEKAIDVDVYASCAVILGSKQAPNFLRKVGITNWLIQYRKPNQDIAIIKNGSMFEKANVELVTSNA